MTTERPDWLPDEAEILALLGDFKAGSGHWLPAQPGASAEWLFLAVTTAGCVGVVVIALWLAGYPLLIPVVAAVTLALWRLARRVSLRQRLLDAQRRRQRVDPAGIIQIQADGEGIQAQYGDRVLRRPWSMLVDARPAVQGLVLVFDDGAECCVPGDPELALVRLTARELAARRAAHDQPMADDLDHGLTRAAPPEADLERALSRTDR